MPPVEYSYFMATITLLPLQQQRRVENPVVGVKRTSSKSRRTAQNDRQGTAPGRGTSRTHPMHAQVSGQMFPYHGHAEVHVQSSPTVLSCSLSPYRLWLRSLDVWRYRTDSLLDACLIGLFVHPCWWVVDAIDRRIHSGGVEWYIQHKRSGGFLFIFSPPPSPLSSHGITPRSRKRPELA